MRLARTDTWDDATRREWEDIKRWGLLFVVTTAVVASYFVARLLTTSELAQGATVVFVAAIVGVVSGTLKGRRSLIDSAEKNSGPDAADG